MKKSNRIFALLLALAMALCLLSGCGSSGDNSTDAPAVDNDALLNQNEDITSTARIGQSDYVRDSITVAFTSATSLSPWGTSNNTPGNYEVYEDLFEADIDGNVFPVLADATRGGSNPEGIMGYDHEVGSTVYTVYIWDNIYDHNGYHITASDVVFSYNYQHDNAVTSGWDVLESVEAVDDTTVEFHFKQELTGVGQWKQLFTLCFIVSERSWNESPSHLLNEMVGTGPYAMLSYTAGSQLTLVAYKDYWQTNGEYRAQAQQANVGRIVYTFINEMATRVMSFKSGEIDLSDDFETINTYDFLDSGEYGGQYNVWSYPAGLIYSFWLNCSDQSICGDVNMRKAIYYAIDMDMLIALNGGTDLRIGTWANSSNSDFYPEWEEIESYNNYHGSQEERAELVKSYLDAAGYHGETLMFLYQSDMADVVTILINLMNQYGINVDSRGTDHAGAASIEADPTQWDMEYGKWGGDYCVMKWQHAYDWANTTEGDHTVNYIYDQEWQDLLNLVQTEDGHTYENMTRWLEIMYENAYGMNLFNSTKSIIYPEDMSFLYRNNKMIILPGACEFTAPAA